MPKTGSRPTHRLPLAQTLSRAALTLAPALLLSLPATPLLGATATTPATETPTPAADTAATATAAPVPAATAAPPSISTTAKKPDQETISLAQRLLTPTKGWSLTEDETVAFDKSLWALEKLSDGSEIYTLQPNKNAPKSKEEKRAILRDTGHLSTISAYRLTSASKPKENSSSVVFFKGQLYALTRCEDEGSDLGRDCWTATPKSCAYARKPTPTFPQNLSDELKMIEVRAIATILTLRGADHQLENVARLGNKLGLKNPLQTTKGKLMAPTESARKKNLAHLLELCRESGLQKKAETLHARDGRSTL